MPLTLLSIDSWSQIAASGAAERLYASGQDATVVRLDVSGFVATETVWVQPGVVQALLAQAGITAPARLSSLAVLSPSLLLAMEHTSNTLLGVDLTLPDQVSFFAGKPSLQGGFADGLAIAPSGTPGARFSFSEPGQICPTGMPDGSVFVCDPGNHAVRRISSGFVATAVGLGTPFFADGSPQEAGLDTPVGLIASCSGRLVVAEAGTSGGGGMRVRQLLVGPASFFGPSGDLSTLAGSGSAATLQGNGLAASLFSPRALCSTTGADTYWIDAGSGILRRMRGNLETVDCPLWNDCATAVTSGGDFSPGGKHSLAQTPAGVLYALDPPAGQLLRITP